MEITLTKENFTHEVVESSLPVLVDFWAEWCMPCRMVSSVIREIAEDHENQLKVGKINVDKEPELINKYKVFSIPALKLFKKGKVVEELVGAQPKKEILKIIAKHLK